MAGLLERQNSPGWRERMRGYTKGYKYYRFIVRIKKDIAPEELESMKREIWSNFHDISILDINAKKINKPTNMKFEGDTYCQNK